MTFQQVGYSPLGAVMDAGWVLYGAMLVVATVLLFDVRKGVAPVVISVLAIVSGIGVYAWLRPQEADHSAPHSPRRRTVLMHDVAEGW